MDIEGKIILDLPMQEGVSKAGNNWKKKEWVLETFGNYPKKVKFTLFGDRATNIPLELGKNYVVSVDIESREFQGRWYTDVNAYAAREIQAPQPVSAAPADSFCPAPQSPVFPPQQPNLAGGPFGQPAGESTDDLPF